MANTFLWRLTV